MTMLAGTNPINWFEIPTADLVRAGRFYSAVFDIELQPLDLGELKFMFFPSERGAANATGALIHHEEMYTPSHAGTLVYFSVRDIDAVLTRVDRAGGRTLRSRNRVGTFGYVGFFEDSEGNRIGLHAES